LDDVDGGVQERWCRRCLRERASAESGEGEGGLDRRHGRRPEEEAMAAWRLSPKVITLNLEAREEVDGGGVAWIVGGAAWIGGTDDGRRRR
jgi:hypothetical protein